MADKTGTLTRNEPAVIDVVTATGTAREEVLAVAAALEARSEHPLAAAILATVGTATVTAGSDVEAVPGNGLRGTVHGREARLGKPGFIAPGPLTEDVTRLQDAGATVVLVQYDATPLGAIAVRDEVRPEAAEAITALKHHGVTVTMLTGDNARTVAAIATDAHITDVRAELMPQDKARIVTELKARGPVAMVGDGINDAPALATAEAGVAMGSMGSDVAIEAADIALMGEDLRRLPDALAHTRAARRIFTQNLVLSGAILAALVPLAATGVLGLATVVATHELAEVPVIANGIRAGRKSRLPAHPPLSTGHTAAQRLRIPAQAAPRDITPTTSGKSRRPLGTAIPAPDGDGCCGHHEGCADK